MLPYDRITSRDNAAFPLDEFIDYAHTLAVDWREEEPRILRAFLRATGLPADDARLEMDPKTECYDLVRGALRIAVPWGEAVSAQHSMVRALDEAFRDSHAIRYLNHAALGDGSWFVVETGEAWTTLEDRNEHVRCFFTPVDRLPDTFKADIDKLAAAGARYAAESR